MRLLFTYRSRKINIDPDPNPNPETIPETNPNPELGNRELGIKTKLLWNIGMFAMIQNNGGGCASCGK
jgi:hypothetical protein